VTFKGNIEVESYETGLINMKYNVKEVEIRVSQYKLLP